MAPKEKKRLDKIVRTLKEFRKTHRTISRLKRAEKQSKLSEWFLNRPKGS